MCHSALSPPTDWPRCAPGLSPPIREPAHWPLGNLQVPTENRALQIGHPSGLILSFTLPLYLSVKTPGMSPAAFIFFYETQRAMGYWR